MTRLVAGVGAFTFCMVLGCTGVPAIPTDAFDTGEPEPTAPTPTDVLNPTSPTDTGTAGPPEPMFEATRLIVSAEFGYDASLDALIPVSINGVPSPPAIYFTFANDAWTGSFADSDNYCSVIIEFANPTQPKVVNTDPDVWFGVVFDEGSSVSDCNLDPTVWGDDLADTLVGSNPSDNYVWVGELSPAAAKAFAGYPNLVGGALGLNPEVFAIAHDDFVATFGYEIDEYDAIALDEYGLIPIPTESINLGQGQIATGYYQLVSFTVLPL